MPTPVSLELKIPPLIVALLFGVSMWAIARVTPGLTLHLAFIRPLAGLMLLAAVGITLAGVLAFRRARTTVDPTRPGEATTIVTGGVYGLTRNPMYAGFLLALVAWALWLGSLPACLLPLLFVKYMNRFQIAPEERSLSAKFGAPYDAYLLRVRRWI
jgi:protein-S-isoprenylcysteine O-methyltransferase Ste14